MTKKQKPHLFSQEATINFLILNEVINTLLEYYVDDLLYGQRGRRMYSICASPQSLSYLLSGEGVRTTGIQLQKAIRAAEIEGENLENAAKRENITPEEYMGKRSVYSSAQGNFQRSLKIVSKICNGLTGQPAHIADIRALINNFQNKKPESYSRTQILQILRKTQKRMSANPAKPMMSGRAIQKAKRDAQQAKQPT